MKINSIPPSNILESYKGKPVKSVQKSEQNVESDRVELSDEAKSFASVIQQVKNSLDTRIDSENKHIEEVAAQVANGTYKVDSSKVADKILGENFDKTI